MAPSGEAAALAPGDDVVVRNLGSQLDGTSGTIKKAVADGKWSVRLDGKSKPMVLAAENLEKVETFDPSTITYSIVGTWNDWEPTEMVWSDVQECFESNVVLGSTGIERFKLLLEGDWDLCVYPSVADACPYAAFELLGPDEPTDDDLAWAIGKHRKDKAVEGKKYTVRFYVTADGSPGEMSWAPADAEDLPPATPKTRAPWAAEAGGGSKSRQYDEDGGLPVVSRQRAQEVRPSGADADDREQLYQQYLRETRRSREEADADEPRRELQEYRMLQREKEARARLERRLERAQEEEALAIKDAEESLTARTLEEATKSPAKKGYGTPVKSRGQPRLQTAPCLECKAIATNLSYGMCDKCYAVYLKVSKSGWNGDILCDGIAASALAERFRGEAPGLSKLDAKYMVLNKFPNKFRPLA